MISQELFDESVLENEDVFELEPEEALKETIEQYQKSGQSVSHLVLSHPSSLEGIQERKERSDFVQSTVTKLDQYVQNDGNIQWNVQHQEEEVRTIQDALEEVANKCCTSSADTGSDAATKKTSKFVVLLDQQDAMYTILSFLNVTTEIQDLEDDTKRMVLSATLRTVSSLLLNAPKPVAIQQKWSDMTTPVVSKPLLQLEWYPSMSDHLLVDLLRCLYACCKQNETNKHRWTQTATQKRLIQIAASCSYGENNDKKPLLLAACTFITNLCRFDDFRSSSGGPTISSTHDTVMEFSRCGIVPVLTKLMDQWEGDTEALSAILSSLRVLAVHDDIVQSMVAAGVLKTTINTLRTTDLSVPLLTAIVGLLRNVSANDDIKTTLCTGEDSILPSLSVLARQHPNQPLFQEHLCALLASMSLRKPRNASRIIHENGASLVVTAMRQHPSHRVLQRQAALALRNLASRATPDETQTILETGARDALLRAATIDGCVDEVYAALRDLGVPVTKTTIHADGSTTTGPQMFGQVTSNFRPVYD